MEKTNDKKLEDRRNRRRTLTGTANHIYGLQVVAQSAGFMNHQSTLEVNL